jgi:hypothetical protein
MNKETVGMIFLIAVAMFGGLYFKAWQCSEMFPNSSLVACLFWK